MQINIVVVKSRQVFFCSFSQATSLFGFGRSAIGRGRLAAAAAAAAGATSELSYLAALHPAYRPVTYDHPLYGANTLRVPIKVEYKCLVLKLTGIAANQTAQVTSTAPDGESYRPIGHMTYTAPLVPLFSVAEKIATLFYLAKKMWKNQ
ncbi:hypothetical protein B5X24_HaOG214797 [Helicoverpa armigera]|nr:hypothetical protein B5X24_HaOG214797 [Helicoverpa armigera]